MQILEHHLDTFGHVNNATYLKLYEQARWEYFYQQGLGLEDVQKKRIGPVILEAKVKFKKELVNREWIIINFRSSAIKGSKLTAIEQEIFKDDGALASSLSLVTGLFDLDKRKLIAPTPEWSAVLKIGETE